MRGAKGSLEDFPLRGNLIVGSELGLDRDVY